MAIACKRALRIYNVVVDVDGHATIKLFPGAAELTLRVVDAAGAGVAWELGVAGGVASETFHFGAGEAYTEDRLALEDDVELLVTAAADAVVEVIEWAE